MKNLLFLLLISIGILQFLISQPQWQRTIGGSNHDFPYSIIQTNDNGFVVAGYTFSYSSGYEDMYIVKLSFAGSIQWTRSIGGTGNDIGYSIIQTSDGGYAIGGWSNSFGTGYADFYVVKLSSAGSFQWNKVINLANNDYGISIVQTPDRGLVLAGLSSTGGVFSSSIYIVKLDSGGSYLWSKTYGGGGDEVAFSIAKTTDGGLVTTGYTNSFGLGGNNIQIMKLDGNGTLQWSKTIGGSGPNGQGYSIIQTTDGGYAIAGVTEAFGAGSYDMHIVKLDVAGTLLWTRTVGAYGQDLAYSIVQTSDGGFTAAGRTNSFGNSDLYVVRLNNAGILLWSKTYGGSGIEGGYEYLYPIIKTTDDSYVITGQTNSFGAGGDDMYIVKFDSTGNTCGNFSTPSSLSGTGGTSVYQSPTVTSQNPTVTAPTPNIGSGGILTTICSTAPPLLPNLVSPPNNSFNQLSSVRFIWNKSTGAQTYRLQLSQDSLFSSLVLNDSTLVDSTIVVTNLTTNKYYWWRVNAKNAFGTSPYSSVWKFGTFLVGLNQVEIKVPAKYKLYNNYPNPFNPSTIIRFDIPVPGKVNFTVYNIIGKEIYGFDENNLSPGTYEYQFVCPGCPSGTYFCRLSSGNFSETRKMILIK